MRFYPIHYHMSLGYGDAASWSLEKECLRRAKNYFALCYNLETLLLAVNPISPLLYHWQDASTAPGRHIESQRNKHALKARSKSQQKVINVTWRHPILEVPPFLITSK